MRTRTHRRTLAVATLIAALAVAALAVGARAAGGVVSSGAAISAGTGATTGAVTVNSCAPLTTPPSILPFPGFQGLGSQQTAAPAFGGAGAGSTAFATSQFLTTIASGTHEFASFTISAGHTVRSDGPLVIRATGDVLVEGTLETLSNASAPIEIHAGGSITVRRQGTQICSVGPAGPGGGGVTLDAQGAVFVGGTQPVSYRANVAYPGNAVSIVSQDAVSGITIDGALCGQSGGAIVVDAPRMSVSNASFASANLGTALRARGASLAVTDTTISGTSVAIEATGALTLTRAGLQATNGDLFLRAYSGSLALSGSSAVASGGGAYVDIAASGDVTLDGDSDVANTAGSIVFVASHGGDVRVDALGGSTSSNINGSGPSCSTGIVAARDILIHADADVAGELGLQLTAQRDIVVRGDPLLRAGTHSMTLRATGVLSVGPHGAGPSPSLVFGDLYATADGAAASSFDFGLAFSAGPVTLVSRGDLTVTGAITSGGALSVGSLAGNVVAAGATLATASNAGGDTAAVEVATWAGCDATIDVSNATIRSGDASGRSGDVRVLVKSGVPAPVGSLLVTRATVKDRTGPADVVVIEGVLDIGDADEPSGDVTFSAGTLEFTFPLRRAGRAIRGTSGTSSLVLTPPRAGSRYGFKATLKADGALVVSEGGTIEVTVSQPTFGGPEIVFGGGTIEIESGRFVLGSRGRIVGGTSTIWVESGSVKFSDSGLDVFTSRLVVAPGTFGLDAPAVEVRFGSVVIDVPATAFVEKSPGVFVLPKGTLTGVTSLVVDVVDGTVTFTAAGSLEPGAGSVFVVESTLVIDGGAPLTTTVRMARRGRRASY